MSALAEAGACVERNVGACLRGDPPARERAGDFRLSMAGQKKAWRAGSAGGASVRAAAALGANVTVFDKNPHQLEAMHRVAPNVTALIATAAAVEEAVAAADLLVGAVLLPGAGAERVVR